MSPRVKRPAKQESKERLAELRAFADQVKAEAVGESPYAERGGYWRDFVAVHAAEQYRTTLPQKHQTDRLPLVPGFMDDPNEAAARLEKHQQRQQLELRSRTRGATEIRALSVAGAGGTFATAGAYDGEAFTAAARAASRMTQVLPVRPLPQRGLNVLIPRFSAGASTAVQISEGLAESSTDPADTRIANPVATIAGEVLVSQQLLDRSEPPFDQVLDEELGRALGENLDKQILSGTGANGQMLGLSTVSGINSTAYTDATATAQECFVKVLDNAASVGTALGSPVTDVLLLPKRLNWLRNWRDTATGIPAIIPWPGKVTEVPAIPANEGAGTNQDAIYLLASAELPVYLDAPIFEVIVDFSGGADVLRARIRVRQYASAGFSRRPEAIGKVSGTGLIPPVFA
jgi:HK97 family phage major capsid protein